MKNYKVTIPDYKYINGKVIILPDTSFIFEDYHKALIFVSCLIPKIKNLSKIEEVV